MADEKDEGLFDFDNRKFYTTGTNLYVLMLGYQLYFYVSEARICS